MGWCKGGIIVRDYCSISLNNTLCRATTWMTGEADLIFIKGTDVKEIGLTL